MPQVVVPTPDAKGNPRTWDEVFPIWNQNAEVSEWRIINSILESVAMNSRMGDKTPSQLKEILLKDIRGQIENILEENLKKLQLLDNPKINGLGFIENQEEVTSVHKEVLDKRTKVWSEYGRWAYYIDVVIDSVGDTYREYK